MATPTRWYHDKATLQAEVEKHGSMGAAADAHQTGIATVKRWWKTHGLPPSPRSDYHKGVHKAAPGDPVNETEILRQRLSELEKHARRERREEVADERIWQRLIAAIETAEPTYAPTVERKPKTKDAHEFVALFSDTHASEVVSEEETLGLNAYDWTIMQARMRRYQESVLSHVEHFDGEISTLHVPMLGDMLSGDIHQELAITNDRPTAEAVVDFAYDAAEWLRGFANEYPWQIKVYGVPGNHPRATQKPQAKQAHNNADWLTYKMIEARLRDDPRFTFQIGKGGFNIAEIAGKRCLLMHGDGIRSSMPGVPWGGVTKRVTTLEQQFSRANQPLDYLFMGHFHAPAALPGIGIQPFLNGSVKGPDEYSLKQFGHGHAASQRLLAFHPGRGVVAMFWIDLQEVMA